MPLSRWETIKNAILDILFPPVCLTCEETFASRDVPENICSECFLGITIHQTMFCAVCGARNPRNIKICHKEAPAMLAAATKYDDSAVKKLIWVLKYQKKLAGVPPISKILSTYIRLLGFDFSDFVVVFVPLHPTRRRKRGFNQAEILGQAIAHKLNLPIINALARVKDNPPQAETKNKEERQKNISGCFALQTGCDIKDKKIILVDDVFTSGATTFEATNVLKNAGAKKVVIFVLAKGN